jgi:hypothetical protein
MIVAGPDDPIEINLEAFDPDGDALVYVIESPPAHGSIAGTAPNVFYLPSDYRGWDSFTFKVNDGTADSDTARIEVKVEEDASTATPDNSIPGAGPNSGESGADDPIQDEPEVTPPTVTTPAPDEPVLPPVVETPPVPEPAPGVGVDDEAPVGQENSASDIEAPRIIFPTSTLVFDSQSEAGTSVAYNIVAIDSTDGEISPDCSPASGSRFPVGKVNVVCTATDSAGNTALGSFTIEVRLLASEGQQSNPLPFDVPRLPAADLQFAVVPFIIAAAVGIVLAVRMKLARKTKARNSQPQKSPS